MTPRRLREIASHYANLRIALVGDMCLDRYFEIDPALREISLETNLPVHNVVRVRCQPGGAGTILNNLLALGIGTVFPVAIIGRDGEGYELRRALEPSSAVPLEWLIETGERRTFTYSKPLLMHKNKPPEELSRLDIKNSTPTPEALEDRVIDAIRSLAPKVNAMILLDQVDIANTGVITSKVLHAISEIVHRNPELLVLADSRRSLRNYPAVSMKMNAAECALYFGASRELSLDQIKKDALSLAENSQKHVFVTLSEQGMVGAHGSAVEFVPALPTHGPIDIVGAGDAVTANLTASLSAGASVKEALQIAQLAASIVIHQLGTTGTATIAQIEESLTNSPFLDL